MSGPGELKGAVSVNGREYAIIRLLGHGKGGYSYLVSREGRLFVMKQIHHEPCDYYSFGNKLEAERHDHARLLAAGIRMPELYEIDEGAERILKQYVEGETAYELILRGGDAAPYLDDLRAMAERARDAGLNIDYFPTNFVINGGLLYYVDYECNPYMEEWDLAHWGIRYWSRTKEFEEYVKGTSEE